MAKWIIPKETAERLVADGQKQVGKSVQTFSRAAVVDEPIIELFKLSSGWSSVSGGSGYSATGTIVSSSGDDLGGAMTIYAPTATSAPSSSSGDKVHAARVNGRWELLAGGGGGTLTAGDGIAITTTNGVQTVANAGVLSVGIGTPTLSAHTGRVYFNYDYFLMGELSNNAGWLISPYVDKIRGQLVASATQSGDAVTLEIALTNL